MNEEERYTIQEIGRLSRVDVRTLFQWMERGLLPRSERKGPGTTYPGSVLARARFIQRLRKEHIPLAQIKGVLEQLEDAPETIRRVGAGEEELRLVALAGSAPGVDESPMSLREPSQKHSQGQEELRRKWENDLAEKVLQLVRTARRRRPGQQTRWLMLQFHEDVLVLVRGMDETAKVECERLAGRVMQLLSDAARHGKQRRRKKE